MSDAVLNQKVTELDALIRFWKESLAEHRLLMSPSSVYLVEQTIKSLQELAGKEKISVELPGPKYMDHKHNF